MTDFIVDQFGGARPIKRVLLTGAGGFIGSHTLAHLGHNTDWCIFLTDSFRHKGKTDRIAEMLTSHPDWHSRTTVITHDLSAPFTDQMISKLGKIDYIINMASESHVDRSIEDPVPFIRNNVDVVLNVLELARVLKPEKFIQVSTDEVYGAAPDGINHPEWAVIKPSNPYSASKAAQEAVAISYWRTYGVPVIITNTMNNFGEMQDPEKFVPMIIKRLQSGETVPVHGNEQKIGSRFYLHARNHADALLFLLSHPSRVALFPEAEVPPRFNVVGDTEMDNLKLASTIAGFMNKPLKYELVDFHATRPGHDPRYALDGSLLKSLGWSPPVPFEESLRSTVEWELEHPEWLL